MSESRVENPARKGQPSRENTGAGAENSLADLLSELARSLDDATDVQSTLDEIVRAAVADVPGAQHASISSIKRRRDVITRAWTSELSRGVDLVQYETGEGPCMDTLYEHVTVRLSDMATEERWPEFTRRVREMGVGSMLAVQLYLDGGNLGALNLFSSHVDAFDDDSEHVALLLAAHAAVAMGNVQHVEQLRQALGNRDLIGQAKGMLMERFGIDAERAFSLLVRASQLGNLKLTEIVREVTSGGDVANIPQPRSTARGA